MRIHDFMDRHYLDDKKDKALKAKAYLLKGRILTELEEKEEAILTYQKALDLLENKEEESFYETLSKIYDDLGRIYEDESLFWEALEMYMKALRANASNFIVSGIILLRYLYFIIIIWNFEKKTLWKVPSVILHQLKILA